jgi:branched-chain amino acid transport system substrate-binding protein
LNKRLIAGLMLAAAVTSSGNAQDYPRGISSHEIKIGQTWPYSGPVSSHAVGTKTQAAYFAMINASGGINGRTINLISLDDAFSPPKTVEQTRRLVEQDEVALLFGSFGTPTNSAVLRYVAEHQIPQLLLIASADRFTDPKQAPWTTITPPSAKVESEAFSSYILSAYPNAKIGVLYENDDFGKLYLANFKNKLGSKSNNIVLELSTAVTDPTIDSQMISLAASGAEVFVDFTQIKATTQAISKAYDLKWNPVHLVTAPASSIPIVMKTAGLEKSQNVVSFRYFVDTTDLETKANPKVKEYFDFMAKWNPQGDPEDFVNVTAYTNAEALVAVVKRCGDDLSKENILKQATNGEPLPLSLLLPGIEYRATPENHGGIHKLQPSRVTGDHYTAVGGLID